ncbi:MAG: hypothetical protein M1827_002799 [Pycnora praestabilis]|nr:MAG: hypothetical protein M1827_002799 [Pycnora praestabilis]
MASQIGILHQYSSRLVAFEQAAPGQEISPSTNTVVFVAGLYDGLLTVPYSTIIAHALGPDYTLTQVLLSSSYTGWGTSSLAKDVAEIAECVKYFKKLRPHSKVVLMGHSTGCQDTMEYLVGEDAKERPAIDGAILQAPVSDREAMTNMMAPDDYEKSCELATQWVKEGKEENILPGEVSQGMGNAPISARRWLSLASPDHDGADDYFSSDLPVEKLRSTFGRLPQGTPLCILYSGEDQYVPKWLDKEALVRKWIVIVKEGNGVVDEQYSGVVKGATHNLMGDPVEVVKNLVQRVVGFLEKI